MAQYCEIAGKVTNCTDNCRNCLEEEVKPETLRLAIKFDISPKKTETQDSTLQRGQSERFFGLETIVFAVRSSGLKERPSGTDVSMSKKRTSNWFDKKV